MLGGVSCATYSGSKKETPKKIKQKVAKNTARQSRNQISGVKERRGFW